MRSEVGNAVTRFTFMNAGQKERKKNEQTMSERERERNKVTERERAWDGPFYCSTDF